MCSVVCVCVCVVQVGVSAPHGHVWTLHHHHEVGLGQCRHLSTGQTLTVLANRIPMVAGSTPRFWRS